MPQPTPRLDDDALVAEILARVPEAGNERRVRSLLAAWWRYAGVRNAAGAVVDSDTFIAERGALGLLEVPPAIAGRVIELEFALLHDPAAAPAPAPPAPKPAPVVEAAPLRVVPPPLPAPAAAAPAVAAPAPVAPAPVAPAPAAPPNARQLATDPAANGRPPAPPAPAPVAARPVAAAPAPAPVAPTPVAVPTPVALPTPVVAASAVPDDLVELDEPVPITAFEAFQEVRERTREQAQTAVMAGFVVFFSLVVGLALLAGQTIDHLALPGGASEPLVAGWRAFLAIFTGFGGALVGLVAAVRLQGRRGALLPPVVGLLGLGVLGLGLLSGSVVIVGAGAAAFALGGLVALLRR